MINLFIFEVRRIVFILTNKQVYHENLFYLFRLYSLKLFTSSQRPTKREKNKISTKYKYPLYFMDIIIFKQKYCLKRKRKYSLFHAIATVFNVFLKYLETFILSLWWKYIVDFFFFK